MDPSREGRRRGNRWLDPRALYPSDVGIYEKGLVTILAVDAVLALISIPLLLRKVPRNVIYGYRTRSTLADDFIWYEANAHFGRGLLIACLVSALAVLFIFRAEDLGPPSFLKATVAALALPPLVATLATARYIRKLRHAGPSRTAPR